MDNKKKNGFVTVNHRVEADYPHALLVMRDLGKLHALSYAMKDHKPSTFKYLQGNLQETFFNSDFFKSVLEMIPVLADKVLKSYNPETETFKSAIENAAQTFRGLLDVERYGEYAVINHGDPEMRNYLFRYGDTTRPSEPTELCMVD
ncbi:uncharacterized protein LOC116164488 [Photinus pyralis]|nr:uncharacterized protein LOC116164488 [Photinus pyralis]